MADQGSTPPVITEPESRPPVISAAGPGRRTKRETQPLRVVLLYLLFVFAGAAIVAPRFYASAHFVAENWGWRSLAQIPFYRFVHRCLLLLAVVGLPVFLKKMQIRSATELGLKGGPRHWGEALQGVGWGFAALAMVAALAVAFNGRMLDLDHPGAAWSKHVQGAAAAAAIVATLEEILFRGAMFGALRRQYSFISAALISGGIYAIVHFFDKPPEPDSVEAWTGFLTLSQMLRGFADWQTLIPGFLNLLMVGLLLALAFERTGAILFSIGLHAGFIFWVKFYGFMTKASPGANEWFWGSNKLVDGWMTAVLLFTMLLVLRRVLPARSE